MKKIIFFAAITVIACNISCGSATSEKTGNSNAPAAVAPEGMALIANSDCMTCHNATAKMVGPSFADIAAKYPANPDNIAKLSSVILNGGTGVWGSSPMPPHPALSKADADKMAAYILSGSSKK